jgi:hypothetical protein
MRRISESTDQAPPDARTAPLVTSTLAAVVATVVVAAVALVAVGTGCGNAAPDADACHSQQPAENIMNAACSLLQHALPSPCSPAPACHPPVVQSTQCPVLIDQPSQP